MPFRLMPGTLPLLRYAISHGMSVMTPPQLAVVLGRDDVLSPSGAIDRNTACADDVELWDDDGALASAGGLTLTRIARRSHAAA